MKEDADIVIVGAGSAGCVLASRLSEDPGRQVVLIEAGVEAQSTHVRQPNQWPLLWDDAENWGYSTTLQTGLGLRAIPYPRGKALGGTSAINAMIAMRGDPMDFDHWHSLGNAGWGWSDVLPYFKRLEDHVLGASARHGVGGPLAVSSQTFTNPITQAFILPPWRAATALTMISTVRIWMAWVFTTRRFATGSGASMRATRSS